MASTLRLVQRVFTTLWCLAVSFTGAAAAAESMPWHLVPVSQADAAPASIGSAGIAPGPHPVVVAVIDSGVLTDHPSLAGATLPGYDMLSAPQNDRGGRSADASPDERNKRCGQRLVSDAYRTHGTEMASIIAGNGVGGVWGVHPQAKVLPVRVMGACGMSRRDLIDGIRWAVGGEVEGVPTNRHPAQVLNLSLSGGRRQCGPDLQAAIDAAIATGAVVVVAAGNSFHKPLTEPANCQGVVSVGALDAANEVEFYTALDPRITTYAPGGGRPLDARAPWQHNKLRVATYSVNLWGEERSAFEDRGVGTSYAAAVVSGFIALWLSHHPKATPDQWLEALAQLQRPVSGVSACPECVPRGLVASPAKMRLASQ